MPSLNTPALALGVIGLDPGQHCSPQCDRVNLGEDPVAATQLVLVLEFQFREATLANLLLNAWWPVMPQFSQTAPSQTTCGGF